MLADFVVGLDAVAGDADLDAEAADPQRRSSASILRADRGQPGQVAIDVHERLPRPPATIFRGLGSLLWSRTY